MQANAIARLRQAETKDQRQPIIVEMRSLELLKGADLRNISLPEIDLWVVDLSFSKLWGANLSNSNLGRSKLIGANLEEANLTGCNLFEADITGARLEGVNFTYSNLKGAKLSSASLVRSDFTGANLLHAECDKVTWFDIIQAPIKLPDGTQCTEIPDLERFTDDTHPLYTDTLARINSIRLDQGQRLLGYGDFPNFVYPLPTESLYLETMRERVNARRAELGLEPLT